MGWGGRLFEAGRLLTSSAFSMGVNSRLGAYSNKYGNPKSDIQELKELLLDKIQSLDRHFDASIRGLARRNESQRVEITLPRTREGQPRCFTCGQTGHLANNCPECRATSSSTVLGLISRS